MFPRQTHSACYPFVHQGASSSDCPAKDVAAFRAPSDLSRRLDNSCNVLYSPNKTSASKEGAMNATYWNRVLSRRLGRRRALAATGGLGARAGPPSPGGGGEGGGGGGGGGGGRGGW